MATTLRGSNDCLSRIAACCYRQCERSIFGRTSTRTKTSRSVAASQRPYTSRVEHQTRLLQATDGDVHKHAVQGLSRGLGFRRTGVLQAQQSTVSTKPSATASAASRLPNTVPASRPTSTASAAASSPASNPPPASFQSPAANSSTQDLTEGLNDSPLTVDEGGQQVDWARSFHGLSAEPFGKEAAEILLRPIPLDDIEIKPDGILYLPEIKYRRILNQAFGPGGWGLAPRSETIVTDKSVTREYALVAHGRLVSVARGEQDYFTPEGIPTAVEGCKSNAMTRCCKDLGVASELWDPRFIRKFIASHTREVFVEHAVTKKRRKIWLRKDDEARYPFKEVKGFSSYG